MDATIAAMFITALISLAFFAVIGLGIYAVTAYFASKVFAKLGVPGYIAWIPFYNVWKWFEIGGFPGALSLLSLLTFASVPSAMNSDLASTTLGSIGQFGSLAAYVLSAIVAYRVAIRFGKNAPAYTAIFVFVPFVYFILLANENPKTDQQ